MVVTASFMIMQQPKTLYFSGLVGAVSHNLSLMDLMEFFFPLETLSDNKTCSTLIVNTLNLLKIMIMDVLGIRVTSANYKLECYGTTQR